MIMEGRAWVFGHNIDTDVITPGQYMASPVPEAAQHAFEAIAPDFSKSVKPGDIIVAGRNFGCGSSREIAPQVIKHLGIGCILAESYARIFFRNAIAIGLPAMEVEGVSSLKTGDRISVDSDTGRIRGGAEAADLQAVPLHPKMREIIEAGGIDGMLKKLGEVNAGGE